MVLGAAHKLVVFAVGKCQNGYFAPRHEFLDDDLVSGSAELLVHHQLFYAVAGLLERIADQNALAEGKAGSLEHDGHLSGLEVLQRFLRIVKDLIGGGRNAVFLHQILGKSLAAFDDRRIGRCSEDTEPLCLERVDNTGTERIIHAADGQIDGVLGSKSGERVKIHGSDRNTFRDLCNAGVAGCAVKFLYLRASLKSLRDRMLSAASAYQ